MLNSLDLLVIVFMVSIALGLLALCLMFLVRRPLLQKICLCVISVLAIYLGIGGILVGGSFFPGQTAVGVLAILVALAAPVLMLVTKGEKVPFLVARVMSAAALVAGLASAFFL